MRFCGSRAQELNEGMTARIMNHAASPLSQKHGDGCGALLVLNNGMVKPFHSLHKYPHTRYTCKCV